MSTARVPLVGACPRDTGVQAHAVAGRIDASVAVTIGESGGDVEADFAIR